MTTAYDVPPDVLINTLAEKMKKEKIIVQPEETTYLKTGVHKENPPEDPNWWYKRAASILRKIYLTNGIGIKRLQNRYSGKKDRGSKPYKVRRGSGSITRKAVQQLEEAGFVKKIRGKGRVITPKGKSFLDNTSYEILKKIENKIPELKKY